MSQVLGFGRHDFLRKIAFPSALPDIVAGLRVSLAIALILAVVTEMQSSLPGLGWDIFSAQRFYRSADIYAGLIMLGPAGLCRQSSDSALGTARSALAQSVRYITMGGS